MESGHVWPRGKWFMLGIQCYNNVCRLLYIRLILVFRSKIWR